VLTGGELSERADASDGMRDSRRDLKEGVISEVRDKKSVGNIIEIQIKEDGLIARLSVSELYN
jgi:hypothetical protein